MLLEEGLSLTGVMNESIFLFRKLQPTIPPERLHRGVAGLGDTVAPKHLGNGEPEDMQVSGQCQVVDIPHVEDELLLPADGIAPMHLCPASDAGAHLMATGLLLII